MVGHWQLLWSILFMIKNFLRVAFRSLTKNKIFSRIYITGLSVGMSAALLTGLWIQSEWSFNKMHAHYERIAQVMQSKTIEGEVTELLKATVFSKLIRVILISA